MTFAVRQHTAVPEAPAVYEVRLIDYVNIGAVSTTSNAVAGYRLAANREVWRVLTPITTVWAQWNDITWCGPNYNPADYDVRATLVSGTLSTGAVDTWTSLATDQSWTRVSQWGTGYKQAVLTIEVRRRSDSVVVATQTVDLNAEGGIA